MSEAQHREKLSYSIAQLLPNVIQGVHIGFLAKMKLTHTQFFVLVAIHSQGRPAMRTLSKNMQVSMPTMTGIIERLVEAQYVKRIAHAEDRRQVLVELTSQGQSVISEFQKAAMRRWQQVLTALNHKEIQAFNNVVDKLRQSLKKKA